MTKQFKEQAPVLIAGGGIGGLTLALTLHQIGVPCQVFEAVPELAPLGVGINLQPNAVRELYDLGLGADMLDTIGIQAKEWALVGRNGNDVYAEPRGLLAGYRWPQYAVHRGQFQMLLLALAVSAINSPWDSGFGRYWWLAFSRSLPVGVLIGLFMAFYVKPRLDRMMQAARAVQA